MYKTKKIYYDKQTGDLIYSSDYLVTKIVSLDDDYEKLIPLRVFTKESIGLLVLTDGQYSQDFEESNGYRVNPTTKTLEFSYPDPNEPEAPQVFVKPLTEQVEKLKERQDATENALLDLLLGGM